jgi:photosystem II stability/assembly factor-like uncharacterized protein
LETEEPLERRRGATAVIVVAVIVTTMAGLAYMYSSQTSKPQGIPESTDPHLVTRDYVTYSFASPTEAWALNIAPNTFSPGQFAIFRTVDRGKQWRNQFSSDGEFFNYGALPVQTVDAVHSFILVRGSTDRLYRTADGGAHWDLIALPNTHVGDVAFSDPNYGWLLTWPDLYVTSDGGTSWRLLPVPPQDVQQISLRSRTEAWMNGFGAGKPYVYTSADAGQTWQRHDLPPPPGGSWRPDSFFHSVVRLLPGAGVVVSDAYRGDAPSFRATSFDGGTTWKHVQPPSNTVAFQDSVHWWAIRGSDLFKSADAGQTWTHGTNALPDWLFRPELYVLDSKHAWVSVSVPTTLSVPGGNGLGYTDDGGLHWTRATVPQGAW